jgi:Domain of unknown function (DUF6438)
MLNLILATVLMVQAAQQPAVDAIAVTTREAVQHRASNELVLHVARGQRTGSAFFGIQVAVTVDAGGAVVSATAQRAHDPRNDYDPAIYADAESLVRALHYVPFERGGHPTAVKFTEYVSVLPPEIKAEEHVPFPEIKDWESIKITLRRTRCFGACPAYRVEVHGDGTVLFQWEGNDGPAEVQRGTISGQNFYVLLYIFVVADFYSLRDSYRLGATDLPTCFTSIEINGHKKQVEDYGGREVGMPLIVTQLEDAIDQAAGTDRWLKERDKTKK